MNVIGSKWMEVLRSVASGLQSLVNFIAGKYIDSLAASVVSTLWAFWVPATTAVAITFFDVGLVPQAFKSAVRLSAARGKTWENRKSSLSAFERAGVPQAWFWHFYTVGLVVNTAGLAVLTAGLLFANGATAMPRAIVILAALQTHLFRRWAESLFLMRYPKGAKMHVLAYFFGLAYYIVLPASLVPFAQLSQIPTLREPMAVLQHLWAHMWPLQLDKLGHAPFQALHVTLAQLRSSQLLAGLAIVAFGQALQFGCHVQLAGMARTAASKGQQASGAPPRYILPTGGLFELVACPHYFAEMVIYTGFWVMCGYAKLPGVILCWVVLNLCMGAHSMLTWYHEKFEDYPSRRKAVIPYVY